MSEPTSDDGPPHTGDLEVDAALQELTDLPQQPLAGHHDRLARVHEVLHGALDRRDASDHP